MADSKEKLFSDFAPTTTEHAIDVKFVNDGQLAIF